jgi:molecular chaperone DnaK (HSP70)
VSHRVLGIDLGTVNSCVAVVEDGRAVILSDDSRTTVPSCLSFQRGKEIVGHAAKRQAVTDPLSTVSAAKRLLGHSYESPEVQAALARAPYPIRPSPLGSVLLEIGGRELTPVQVSARILQRLREVAEKALEESVTKAIISVPAHFTDVQRKATKLAAEYAGLEVIRLINEPTAAAFAYGYRKGEDFRLAVYDLGGGTFDITVMNAQGDCFQVDATDGDSYLGGEDFDNATVDWLVHEFREEHGHDPFGDESARRRLQEAAEKAKIELGELEETQIDLPFLTQLPDGTRPHFSRMLTREKQAELVQPLIQQTLDLCNSCLEAAGIQRIDVNEVLLVGGQSRMPAVREAVREFFGKEPRRDINPDEVVAMGAALYGYSLTADDLQEEEQVAAEEAYSVALKDTLVAKKLLDEVEKLRMQPLDDRALAARLESLLAETEADGEVDSLADIEPPPDTVLPGAVDNLRDELQELRSKAGDVMDRITEELTDEPPAEGDSPEQKNRVLDRATERLTQRIESAQQASNNAHGHLKKAKEHASARKVKLIDVASHALGIASAGELFSVLIEKNVPIPTEKERIFTTYQDDQAEVEIRVFQGASSHVSKNQSLGAFVLEGITPAPRMEPRIEVTFRIDENGILAVRARDTRSGAEQGIRVEDPLELQQTKAPETNTDTDYGNIPLE